MYTQVLIYTHLHLCTTSTLMNDLDRCQPARIGARHCPTPSRNPGPDSDADESRRDESRQSRTVTIVTWMSHGSHEPDAVESRRKHAGYQCLGCKQTCSTILALDQHTGSPYLRGTRCGVQHSAAELLNVPRDNLATGQA